MYNVSNDYITTVRSYTREDKITGTITFPNGTVQNITDAVLGEGSLSINRQCVDGEELAFGSAILTELDMSIRTNVSRYSFYDAAISLTYSVKIDDDWEDVPLGTFVVSEATKLGTLVKVTAYDCLINLDKQWGDTAITGTPYEVLDEICDQTDLELGITASDISTWPNADQTIQIDSTSGCKTYREAVRIVCQMIGAFAQSTRDNKLTVKQFHKTVDTTLTERHRYSLTVADFTCSYGAVEVTGLAGTFTGINSSVTSGLTMTIDDAPAWDYGLPEVLQARVQSLVTYLANFTYVPCEINMPGDPAFDCGDRLKLSIGNENLETVITEINWKYRASMDITSVGKNPYLSSSQGISEASNRVLTRQNEDNKIVMYDITNTGDIVIQNNITRDICKINFASTQSTTVLFYASIILETEASSSSRQSITTNATFYDEDDNAIPITGYVSGSGYTDVKVTYYLNGTEYEYKPIEHYVDGKHTMVLFYPIQNIDAQSINVWEVKMTSTNGTVTIKEHNLKAVLYGQSLVAGAKWDGTIIVKEVIGDYATVSTISAIDNVSANVSTRSMSVDKYTYNEYVNQLINIAQISLVEDITHTFTVTTEDSN